MARFRTYLWLMVVCFLASCMFISNRDNGIPHDESLSAHIIEKATTGKAISVPLSSVAEFEWDTVYVIHPRMHPAEVRELGGKLPTWAGPHSQDLKNNVSYTFLSFVKEGEVIRVAGLPHSRQYVFGGEEEYTYFSRDEAFITTELVKGVGLVPGYRLINIGPGGMTEMSRN